MKPINVMIVMQHLIGMVYAACVTCAAIHFGKIAILAWYLLLLFILPSGNKTNQKGE